MAKASTIKKVTFKIEGMHCVSCAFDIDGVLEETEGVKKAETIYARQETRVEFDESAITESAIKKLIQHAGYACDLLSD